MVALLITEILTLQQLKKKTNFRGLSYKKFHKRQNDRKGLYTLAHFCENCKKVKIEVTGPKKVNFFNVFRQIIQKRRVSVPVTSFLTFLHFSKKCAEYIDPSGRFVFNEIL